MSNFILGEFKYQEQLQMAGQEAVNGKDILPPSPQTIKVTPYPCFRQKNLKAKM